MSVKGCLVQGAAQSIVNTPKLNVDSKEKRRLRLLHLDLELDFSARSTVPRYITTYQLQAPGRNSYAPGPLQSTYMPGEFSL